MEKQKLMILKGIFVLNNSKNPNEHLVLFIEEEWVKLELCEKETKLLKVSWT